MEINLLPGEIKPKGYALSLSRKLKKASYVSLGLLFVMGILYLLGSVLLNINLNRINSDQEKLKNEIKALEQTEQKLVLIQDRITKLSKVMQFNDAKEEMDIAGLILEKNIPNIEFNNIKLDKDKALLTISTNSSSNITNYYSSLVQAGFKNMEMVSFAFENKSGYRVQIALAK